MKSIIHWTPTKVSIASVLVMALVVIGIGLAGTSYVINYLYKGMVKHALDHNHEVAQRLEPLLAPRIATGDDEQGQLFRRVVQIYGSFGYRIFVVDDENRLVADSGSAQKLPAPLRETWVAELVRNREGDALGALRPGSYHLRSGEGHPMLISVHEIRPPDAPDRRFLLGVVSDQRALAGFVDDLHRNLDAILLASFFAIGLIGVLGMRAVGRVYERRLETALAKRTRELEAAHRKMVDQTRLATIGQTASVLAHEMRNPLSSIKLALSGLEAQEALSERAAKRIGLVIGEVDRLESLLSQTLDYARPLQLSERPVNLDRLISRLLEQQHPLLAERGLSVEHRRCPHCPPVRVDEDKMYQVFLNVLKNAIEASPPDGVLQIELQSEGADRVRLRFTNRGELPDREVLQKAFEPFFTTKPQGAGLGLGLVKRIVEEHGGQVSLQTDGTEAISLVIELPTDGPGQ